MRVAIAAIPLVAAIGCSSLVSRALPSPVSGAEVVRWWACVIAVSTSALLLADRFTRRFMPLSVLLRMSLPFPEARPSRIRVAIRSGNPRQLERWAASVSLRGRENPKAIAAHELLGLVTALSVHDRRSRGHSERVRVYTDLMAEQLGLSKEEADKLRWASLLHDIGKIRVPSEILNKPGAPDKVEWEIIKRHPLEGDLLIEPVRDWLGSWGRAVIEHHEKWDGTGYPRGLSGTQISLAGRVVAVTDSYEVMTATRSYKKPMSVKAARAELARSAGTHFDPAMVRAFLNVPIGRASWTAGPIAWLAQLPFLGQVPTWGASAASAAIATSVVAAAPVLGVAPTQVRPEPIVVVADAPAENSATGTATPAVRVPVDQPAAQDDPSADASAIDDAEMTTTTTTTTALEDNTTPTTTPAAPTTTTTIPASIGGSAGLPATTTTVPDPPPATTTTVPVGNQGNGNGGPGKGQGSTPPSSSGHGGGKL